MTRPAGELPSELLSPACLLGETARRAQSAHLLVRGAHPLDGTGSCAGAMGFQGMGKSTTMAKNAGKQGAGMPEHNRTPCYRREFPPAIPQRVAPQQSPPPLHRVIVHTSAGTKKQLPSGRNEKKELWTWMDGQRKAGNELLAISHNANLSDGRMYPTDVDLQGRQIDRVYAE